MTSFHDRAISRIGHLALAALAVSILVLAFPEPALSAGGGTITGTVSATPPKFLGDTVVYVKSVPGTYAPKTIDFDQKNKEFMPHVLVITAGDTVNFQNHDVVTHNVFSTEGGYNLGSWNPNEMRSHKFDKPGTFTQLCSLHPEMLGYIFVGQNPYAAAVDAAGHFTIKDVPPGAYQLAVWNSHLKGADQNVTVTAGGTVQASIAIQR